MEYIFFKHIRIKNSSELFKKHMTVSKNIFESNANHKEFFILNENESGLETQELVPFGKTANNQQVCISFFEN